MIDSLREAINQSNHFGSAHKDALVTNDANRAAEIEKYVDPSSVLVKFKTRFTGLG
jgi:gamma-glutamyl phosphate reductase